MCEQLELKCLPTPRLEAVLCKGLNDEAKLIKGMKEVRSFGIYIEDGQETILGGAKGAIIYGNLYVDALWINSRIRNRGWGTQLMKEAERIGKNNGCLFATVNTMDWEALPFYQKLGYTVEFVREGFENNSKMFMLRKEL